MEDKMEMQWNNNRGNVNAKIWKKQIVEDILEIFNH